MPEQREDATPSTLEAKLVPRQNGQVEGTARLCLHHMKLWFQQCLKLSWSAYMLLTSFYCLLAFLPYTYYALIKAPAYEWMPWFVRHHSELYWVGLVGAAAAYWPHMKNKVHAIIFGALILGGVFITLRPFLPDLQNGIQAYLWSVAALMPVLVLSLVEIFRRWPKEPGLVRGSLSYSPV